ncbi:MAG: aldo/keto reductase [Deltaproteobacteria bacterium]|nr:aldo/keto reductase [Deltaproteobacteria bacterium]MCW5801482.1 aldo/keto reductase [Deltaproteobacteria bacterium]
MKYRNLGKAGVRVSNLCLGAMTFGEADEKSFMHKVGSDEQTSHAVLDRALAAGINFIDTADVYGQDGLSERVLGNWIAARSARDKIVLATKFRFTMGDGANRSGASRYRIVKCCEDSLRRLRTDRIDLYQIHMQDITVPEEETLRALDDLVRAGKVLYPGCSNYAAYRLANSLWIARDGHLSPYVTLQAQYNLLVRDLEREHLPLCRESGVGILAWSPLAGGFLTGKFERGVAAPAGTRLGEKAERFARYDHERNWKILDAVRTVAAELEATPSSVSLAWLLHRPLVTSVIFGARTVEQLEASLPAAELSLSPAQLATLDQASAFDLGYPYSFIQQTQSTW